jgi:alpha-L-rhamnosidase
MGKRQENHLTNQHILQDQIDELTTNQMKNPLGLDEEKPSFSWKTKSNRRGAYQKSYHIVVAKEETFANLVWDSGKVDSDQSIGIPYEGEALEASTRYYWKVVLWNEKEEMYASDSCWFETGLMGTDAFVWHGAKWIGSPFPSTNAAALDTYAVEASFQVEKGNRAGIVVAARNKDNYVLFEVDVDLRVVKAYEYCDNAWEGSYAAGNTPAATALGEEKGYPISHQAVPLGKEYAAHFLQVEVNKRAVTVLLNGEKIIDAAADFMPQTPPNAPRKSCLQSIGFKQINTRASYNHITVKNLATGVVYQQADFKGYNGVLTLLGEVCDGRLVVEDRFEVTCPIPAVHVKRTLYLSKKIQSARLYASAQGFYNAFINHEKVGEDFFNPGFTDYRLRIQYQTFDVTKHLQQGENTLLAIVGKGYYSGYCGYSGPMVYGEENTFIAQLMVTYEDGTKEVIVTDSSWEYTDKGPVNDTDYLDGEQYDARLDFKEWEKAEDKGTAWRPCKTNEWPKTVHPSNGLLSKEVAFELSAQRGPTARIERRVLPLQVIENPKGHYVYDFGQNMVGTIKLTVKGKRGTSLKMRYAETCYQNGEIYIQNIRSAANTDTYTLKGALEGETFTPSYTSHGFRYVEITGNGFTLENSDLIVSIEGLVLCNVLDVTGGFECSNPLINQLQKNIQWGQRGNYLLVPTDCPQRNERMGWSGDAQVFAGTAAYNMDVAAFTSKWLLDLMDGQLLYNKQGAVPDTAPLGGDNRTDGCAGWGDAAVIVPWEMYLAYGDLRILEECYEMMQQWVSYQSLEERQNNGLRIVNGIPKPEESDLASTSFIQVQQRRGDHLAYDESTPFILSATAYAAHVSQLMSQIAMLLDKSQDALLYKERFEKIKQAFNETWVKEDGCLGYWGEMSKTTLDQKGNTINQTYYSNEKGNPNHPSQTAYALAIHFGLIEEEKIPVATNGFKQALEDQKGFLSVGFLGISHLAPALTKVGLVEEAFRLLEEEGNPSWLYSVVNGATTIWERWDSYIAQTDSFQDVSMNSFNHYAYGAIGEWMYRTILGIQTSTQKCQAGYKHIVLTPTVGGTLTYAKGWHESPYGRIVSGWQKTEEELVYHCTIPPNTIATLYIPANDPYCIIEGEGLAKEAEGVTFLGMEDGKCVYSIKSGEYFFKTHLAKRKGKQ